MSILSPLLFCHAPRSLALLARIPVLLSHYHTAATGVAPDGNHAVSNFSPSLLLSSPAISLWDTRFYHTTDKLILAMPWTYNVRMTEPACEPFTLIRLFTSSLFLYNASRGDTAIRLIAPRKWFSMWCTTSISFLSYVQSILPPKKKWQ